MYPFTVPNVWTGPVDYSHPRSAYATANKQHHVELHLVVCTVGNQHALDLVDADRSLYQHYPVDVDPLMLGFECHGILRDRWGNYDYYCYLEDDLVLHDSWLFAKLAWFNHYVGQDKLLQPNRFERGPGPKDQRVYVDGELAPHVTKRFQNVEDQPRLESTVMNVPLVFCRTLNPHAGCFFLNADQMQHWINQPFFLDRATSFVGPLESAATLGVMRAFKVYKPAPDNANFWEIEHYGTQFLGLIRYK